MRLAVNLGNCLEHKTMRNSPPVHGSSLSGRDKTNYKKERKKYGKWLASQAKNEEMRT